MGDCKEALSSMSALHSLRSERLTVEMTELFFKPYENRDVLVERIGDLLAACLNNRTDISTQGYQLTLITWGMEYCNHPNRSNLGDSSPNIADDTTLRNTKV